jgi:hypothetical protein
MKKRILIVLYLLYILIINHTFIIANRVTVFISALPGSRMLTLILDRWKKKV